MKTERHRLVLTVGARLAIWAAAMTLSVSAVVCVILYVGLDRSLHREVDGFLEGEIHEFESILKEESEEGDLTEAEREIRRELGSRLRGDLTFRLLDDSGRLMLTSDPQDPFPNPWPLAQTTGEQESGHFFATLNRADHHAPAKFCNLRIVLGGRPYLAQAGYILTSVEKSLAGFRRTCLLALAAAAILAAVAGVLLARRSLRPIGYMTETARRIGAGRLADRIPRSGTGDELDALAATLNEMLDRLDNYVARLRQFTADAAHEIRTPIAALRGAAEVALSQVRSAQELRQVVEASIEHYERLGRLTEDLLFLARADAGHVPLKMERMRLDQAITDVVDFYAPLADERGIHVQFMSDGPIWIEADAARIHQLFSNLVDNALKHVGGGSRLDIRLKSEGDSTLVRVADDGPGISPDDLPHVFERFYRADKARSSAAQVGAGLGLPICKAIAELHNGEISIESKRRCGTIVLVRLPLSTSQRR